jgi:nicotinic acid mononucleotide adenylyltransferase/nicotinamide mononucleotide (NMN) deamidase PncC
MDKALIEKINSSPFKVFVSSTGGGQSFLSEFCNVPGASQTIVGGFCPYSQAIFDKNIGKVAQYSSGEAARKLAVYSYNECLSIGIAKENAIGLGISCSLSSTNERIGRKHRICIALHTFDQTSVLELTLEQGRAREEEEMFTRLQTLGLLANLVCKTKFDPERFIFPNENSSFRKTIANQLTSKAFSDSPEAYVVNAIEHEKLVIYPGSFSLLHDGHKQIVELTEEVLNAPCYFEITVKNAEKGQIDFVELYLREQQLKNYSYIISNIALMREKAVFYRKMFPDKEIIFVCGQDTWQRIWSEKYLLEGGVVKEHEIFSKNKINFLVFPRGNGQIYPFVDDLRVAKNDERIKNFKIDLSSTDLKKNVGI